MRDLNEDSSSNSWPSYYGDKDLANGQQSYNGFVPRTSIDGYPIHVRDAMKQKILEHETLFRSQLYELHRLYRIQKDMMEEVKRKELHKLHFSTEPLVNSGYGRASALAVEIGNSPMSCTKEHNTGPSQLPFLNGSLDSRPSKVRKKLFDLQLPADRYMDNEERENFQENNVKLADLNEPIQIEEELVVPSPINFLGHESVVILPEKSRISNSCLQSAPSSHLVPAKSFTQKRAIFDSSSNSATAVDRNLQPFGGNWKVSFSSSLNPNPGGELTRSGFHRGSTSKTQETQVFLPLSRRNSDRGNNSCHEGGKKTMHIDLNNVVDLTIEDERDKPEDCLSSLPWLRNKRFHAVETANTRQDEFPGDKSIPRPSSSQPWWKSERVGDIDRHGAPRFAGITSGCEILETTNVKKILGVPILENNARGNNRSPTSTSVCFHAASNEQKKRIIDINLECEPIDDDVASEKENGTNVGVVKNKIDLNSCVSDSEDPYVPSFESKTATAKRILEIDLEAPPLQESEDDDFAAPVEENTTDSSLQPLQNKNMLAPYESLEGAAEMILSMSSFCPQTHVEENVKPLVWFVDIVSSYSNELEKSDSLEKGPSEVITDDFEAMTLKLREMKEDYLPQPFIRKEIEERETNNSLLSSRLRRGHSRRGRQRKDFQRDILPGLSTLSRHEVTEDLQTFGGIMRAMGHQWNSGLSRRNGGARGRRRAAIVEAVLNVVVVQNQVHCADAPPPLVQKLSSNFEQVLEDRRLSGWGKTTRRPRRQRYHAGNNNAFTAVFT